MRLLIAIPCADVVRYEFAESLAKLLVHLSEEGIDFEPRFLAGSLIYSARDSLAITAINDGYTHVLWLDSDMQFTPDTFDLLRAANKPFVSAIYRSRRSPYALCLFADTRTSQRVLKLPDDVFEIEGCGFGCTLMETQVLKDVKGKCGGQLFLPTAACSEDLAFCDRYRSIGGHIYAVPDAITNHICYVPLRCDDPQHLVDYLARR